MDLQNLTKKNQEFIHIATHQLIQDGKSDAEIKIILEEALPNILEAQKKGIPARTLLGAPTVWAASFTPKEGEAVDTTNASKNTNPWLMWLDTSLLFFGVVTLLNAVLIFFNSKTVTTGITSIFALSFAGGGAMYATYHMVYRHMGKDKSERPRWYKVFGVLLLAMLSWILIYVAASLLPATLNPQLPALVLLIIGAAAFGLRYYLQKRYNILSTMAPQPR